MTALVVRANARSLPLPNESVDLICTSPPYFGLRDYRDDGASLKGQIGAEPTPAEYVASLLECTREWMRVLKPEGSLWINLGDRYAGNVGTTSGHRGNRQTLLNGWSASRQEDFDRSFRSQPNRTGVTNKSLMGLPWRYALGCIDDLGMILRAEIIWSKPNGLPESVTDRVRRCHETWFHLVKQPRYYSAVDEIRTPASGYIRQNGAARATPPGQKPRTMADACNPLGALPGSVWEIAAQPLKVPEHLAVDHYAAFPPALVRRLVLGWSPPGICTACGEGRRPVVDKLGVFGGDNNPDSRNGSRRRSTMDGGSREWARRIARPDRITGYACACPAPDAPTRPSLVVDPFGGTGTTALVASVHGRVGISCDLSHDYGRLARWRTRDQGERARALGVPKPPPVAPEQGDLFAEDVIA
jgi:DNA modification methylase